MKRQVILLVTAIIVSSLSALAQSYSATFHNAGPTEAMAILRKATGHDFVYQKSLLESNGNHVNGEYKDISLNDLLDKTIVDQLNMSYKVTGNTVTINKANVQTNAVKRKISGTVVDEDDTPMPGATVTIEGTQNIVATDIDGKFAIDVNAINPTLSVSYIGMKPYDMKLTAENTKKPLRIVLQTNASIMNEVVVTGYQEVKKEKMTGSVTTISAEKLAERYTPNLLNNLEGRVAGLSTYGGQAVIRGVGSLHGSSSPLLVVDGLPVESSISDLNPYDIMSVNILKDAAASAIYGARAANGIIVVTTKNARTKGKIDIGFSTDITVYENRNVDYSDNFYMTPEQQVNAEAEYYDYYFNSGSISDPLGLTKSAIEQGNQISPIRYGYYELASGNISQEELDSRLNQLKSNNFARDYADAVYRRQVIQQYNLSLRGSNDKMRNNLVINYRHNNNGMINSNDNRLNISYKGSFDLAKWLTVTAGINGIYDSSKQAGDDSTADYTNIWSLPAYTPFYNTDGTRRTQYYAYSGNEYWTGQEGMEDLGVDIINELYANVRHTRRQNMRYHADLLFMIIPGLTANAQFTYEVENTQIKWEADKTSHAARSIRNGYAYKDKNGNITRYVPENGGMMQTTNRNGNYWTVRGQLNYNRIFWNKHEITAIAGLEFRDTKNTGVHSLAIGYDDQLQSTFTNTTGFDTLANLDYAPYFICSTRTSTSSMYPAKSMLYMDYFQNALGIDVEKHHRYASGYANLTYTFDDRYNIFGSYRKDYADVYGLNSKFRGQPLWSTGIGWNIHNESFIHDMTWLNFLKLRFSYGVTGNIYQDANSFMTATTTDINSITKQPEARVKSPANPYLRWEKNRTTNLGVDYSFLNYRLRGSLDYYIKKGEDIFAQRTLDPTSGFASMNGNVASIRNRGIEVAIAYDWIRPSKGKGFGWTTSLTLSHNKNIVTNVETPAKSASQLLNTPFKTGYPVSAIWSYRFAGIGDQPGEEGQLLWYSDEEGNRQHRVSSLAPSILEYSGQRDPKLIMGMENTLTWNGLRLGVTMVYYGGHKMRALAETEMWGIPDSPISSYFLNAWTPDNHTSTPGFGQYGSVSNSMICSEAYYSNAAVRDADFLKIRNITLSYDLPARWLRHAGISGCQLRMQLNEPKALWTKNKLGIDPETLSIRGRSSYVFGLNLNL
ncbi:MAG: SusC/RagA family TonB-linked outer membrane protein [Paenibacillus sp.]|nr:SusC/RagA family TonB-linked outer membrane protein [Paenibacillus sp.]